MIDKIYKTKDLNAIQKRLLKAGLKIDVKSGKARRELMREIIQSKNKYCDESVIDYLLQVRK